METGDEFPLRMVPPDTKVFLLSLLLCGKSRS